MSNLATKNNSDSSFWTQVLSTNKIIKKINTKLKVLAWLIPNKKKYSFTGLNKFKDKLLY